MAVATKTRKAASSARTRTATAATTKTVARRRASTAVAASRGVGTTTTKKMTVPSITAHLRLNEPAVEMLETMFRRTNVEPEDLLRESISFFINNNIGVLTATERMKYQKEKVIL